jgi:predicted CoA-binding protein
MTATTEAARHFLGHHRIAVTGVSQSPSGHGSNAVYVWLREHGYEVFAVNPHADMVEGDRAYGDLGAIPGGVDAVVIATAPEHAMGTMEQASALGIRDVWMHRSFGKGSVAPAATVWGREHGMTVIDGGCPIMFHPDGDGGHHMMCRVLTWTGRVPRTV